MQLYRNNRDNFAEMASEQGSFATAPLGVPDIIKISQ